MRRGLHYTSLWHYATLWGTASTTRAPEGTHFVRLLTPSSLNGRYICYIHHGSSLIIRCPGVLGVHSIIGYELFFCATPATPPGTIPNVITPLPPVPLIVTVAPPAAPAIPAAMPSDAPRSSSNGCFVPVLTKAKANFLKWQVCVLAYLTPHDHVRVLERVFVAGRSMVDPVAPTDARQLESWLHSERIARGIIVSTAVDLHLELVHQHRQGNPWTLWQAVEAKHVKQDASFRHGAWMTFLGVRHGVDEPYMNFLNRISDARAQIDHVTPPGLTIEECMDELLLFTALCGMRADDPLRRQLVPQ